MTKQRKAVPKFANEAEERIFWETHDSTEYLDWSKAPRVVRRRGQMGVEAIRYNLRFIQ